MEDHSPWESQQGFVRWCEEHLEALDAQLERHCYDPHFQEMITVDCLHEMASYAFLVSKN